MSATPEFPFGSPLGSSTGGHSKLDDEPRSKSEMLETLQDALADAKERRYETEMSDDRAYTNGRIKAIDDRIADIRSKIEALGGST